MFLNEASDGDEIDHKIHKSTKDAKVLPCLFFYTFVIFVVNLFLRKFIPAIAIQQQP
jgi:hypothetical protein